MAQNIGQFLSEHAPAIQAFSAMVTLVLTAALVIATFIYVRATNRMLRVSQGQLRASVQPQLLIGFSEGWREDGTAIGTISLKNVGSYYFKLQKVHVDYYCSKSEERLAEPHRLLSRMKPGHPEPLLVPRDPATPRAEA